MYSTNPKAEEKGQDWEALTSTVLVFVSSSQQTLNPLQQLLLDCPLQQRLPLASEGLQARPGLLCLLLCVVALAPRTSSHLLFY
jgi:hypothetical protein